MSHKSSVTAQDKTKQTSDNMIERLRRKISAKSIVGTVLLFMIASVFVFFGLPTSKYGGTLGSVAEVNGQFVSVADFQQEENRIMEQYSQYFKGQDMGPMRKMLRSQALNNLVTMELVSQGASLEKLYITPTEIRDVLVNEIPAFQENGRFKRDRYQQYLDGTRTTANEFEQKVEKSLLNMRLRRLFESALIPSQFEVEKILNSKAFTVKLAYVKVEKEKAKPDPKVKPEDAEKKATENYQSEVKKLTELVQSKDFAQVDGYLKNKGLKWKEVEGNLQQLYFGELPLKVAEEALMNLKKAGDVHPALLSEGADQYLVKLVSIHQGKIATQEQDKEKESINKKYAMTVFENWISDFKKSSNVHENAQFLESMN